MAALVGAAVAGSRYMTGLPLGRQQQQFALVRQLNQSRGVTCRCSMTVAAEHAQAALHKQGLL